MLSILLDKDKFSKKKAIKWIKLVNKGKSNPCIVEKKEYGLLNNYYRFDTARMPKNLKYTEIVEAGDEIWKNGVLYLIKRSTKIVNRI